MDRRTLLTDVRYRVELDLTARADGATSRTEVRFRCAQPGATDHVDVALAGVTRVEFNGVTLPLSAWRQDDGQLDLPVFEAENILLVEGVVGFATGRDGLCTFVDDGGERFVYLHLPARDPFSAALVIACFVGAGRSRFELDVIAPAGWSVYSYAKPTVRPSAGAAGLWRFLTPLPTEPRLQMAAGQFASRGDVHARPSLGYILEASPIGALLEAVIAQHEAILEVPHPFDQLPCVLIPGYGSQGSNAGGITLCHERILSGSVEDEWRAYVLWVLAHESAHSWFGAVFEVAGPEHHWLYEGIATYLCHRVMAELTPELWPWARYHVLEEAAAHAVDCDRDTHAISALPSSSVLSATRGHPEIVYGKPAAILRQLEHVIGQRTLDRALGDLLRDHAGDVVTTADFVRSVENAADADLTAWMDDWIYSPGVNTLRCDPAAGTVLQTASADGRLRTHRLPVQAFDVVANVLVPRPPIMLTVFGELTPVPELTDGRPPDLVVLNAPATTYARVRLDEGSRSTLAHHLGALDPDTRAVCWVAAMQMVADSELSAAEYRTWIHAHGDVETDPLVRDILAKV